MSLIDRAKSLHMVALDRLMPQRVVFHHVPKCGGTSVGRGLRSRYILSQATVKPEQSFRAFEAFTGRTDHDRMLIDVLDLREQMMLYLLFDDVRCLSLHVRYSSVAHALFADRYAFITILRDPVERFLSHYNWDFGRTGEHAMIDQPLDAFLKTPRAARMGAAYVDCFGGLPKEADIRTDAAIDAAIANLSRFDVVGYLDDLPGFIRDLRRRLRVRVRVGHENKGKGGGSTGVRAQLHPDLMAKIEAICAPDIRVWTALRASRATTQAAADGHLATA